MMEASLKNKASYLQNKEFRSVNFQGYDTIYKIDIYIIQDKLLKQ